MNDKVLRVVLRVLNWIFVILLLLAGLGAVSSGSRWSGLIFFLIATIISPPITKLAERTLHFKMVWWMKVAIGIVGLIVAASVSHVASTQQFHASPGFENDALIQNHTVPGPLAPTNASKVAVPTLRSNVAVSPSAVTPSTTNIKAALTAWGDALPTSYTIGKVVNATPGPLDEKGRAQLASDQKSANLNTIMGTSPSVVTRNTTTCLEGYSEQFRLSNTLVGNANIYRFTSSVSASDYYSKEVEKVKQARGYTAIDVEENCFAWSIDHYDVYVGFNAVCLRSDIVLVLWYNDYSGDINSSTGVLVPGMYNLDQEVKAN